MLPVNDVSVSLTTAVEDDSVVLRYVVENGTEDPVMVLDRMRDWSKPQSWTSSVLPLQEDCLSGHLKTGQSWTGQNRPVGGASRREFA